MIDPTPPFEKLIQNTWGPTQEFYVGLLFVDKDELQTIVKQYHIKRNQTFSVKESDLTYWFVRCKHCSWRLRAYFQATHGFFFRLGNTMVHTHVQSPRSHKIMSN